MMSRGNWEPPGKNQNPATDRNAPRLAGTLRRQFRECINRLTGHSPAPQPKMRRRRTEDTGRAFRMTARKIMRRTARIPAAATAAVAYLWDTLDWLNQCHHTDSHLDEDFQPAPSDHLYPHL